ncbi:MAG: hypothetical protein FWF24_01330 [Alphaproteobacteria bacterium]|nr:hypothetical protein [Alphaproteobacteria bacterium]
MTSTEQNIFRHIENLEASFKDQPTDLLINEAVKDDFETRVAVREVLGKRAKNEPEEITQAHHATIDKIIKTSEGRKLLSAIQLKLSVSQEDAPARASLIKKLNKLAATNMDENIRESAMEWQTRVMRKEDITPNFIANTLRAAFYDRFGFVRVAGCQSLKKIAAFKEDAINEMLPAIEAAISSGEPARSTAEDLKEFFDEKGHIAPPRKNRARHRHAPHL